MAKVDRIFPLCVLLLACLPWLGTGIQTMLVIICLAGCCWQWYRGRAAIPLCDPLLITFLSLVLLIAFRDLFGDTKFFSGETKTLVLFPLLLLVFHFFRRETHKWPLLFALSASLHALTALIALAFQSPFPTFNQEWHFREALGDVYGIHPTYLSMMWGWALVLLLHGILHRQLKNKLLYLPAMLVLMAGISVSAGKMPIVATATASAMLLFFGPQSKWVKFSFAGLLVAILATLAAVPNIGQRFSELGHFPVPSDPVADLNSTQMRTAIWQCAVGLFHENILIGTGESAVQASLTDCYKTFGQHELLSFPYNTHNQFLHFAVGNGIPGLSLFLCIFVLLMWESIRRRDPLLAAWTLFMFLCLLTENYLSRQLGVIFMGSWTGYLWGRIQDVPFNTSS